MRLLTSHEDPIELGFAVTFTPLQARLLASSASPEWDACDTWELLHRGRGALCRSDPDHWFDSEELGRLPRGLVAELYASSGKWDKFNAIIAHDAGARRYLIDLPMYVHTSCQADLDLVRQCADMAMKENAKHSGQIL